MEVTCSNTTYYYDTTTASIRSTEQMMHFATGGTGGCHNRGGWALAPKSRPSNLGVGAVALGAPKQATCMLAVPRGVRPLETKIEVDAT